jgi:hypothetical protein
MPPCGFGKPATVPGIADVPEVITLPAVPIITTNKVDIGGIGACSDSPVEQAAFEPSVPLESVRSI